ncbi:MAG: response regulator [Desulfobacteraceae bacterium]|nr:response regulator [Desulfobacteraceae bacterium]
MKRILIVDDDEQFRLMLRRVLEKEGYEVHEAVDGRQAIASFRRLRTDLIITDIIMPEKEGVETIVALRQEFPTVKIIAVSGGGRNAPGDYLLLADKLGAQVTMEKPLDRARLLVEIKDLTNIETV